MRALASISQISLWPGTTAEPLLQHMFAGMSPSGDHGSWVKTSALRYDAASCFSEKPGRGGMATAQHQARMAEATLTLPESTDVLKSQSGGACRVPIVRAFPRTRVH